MLMEYGIQGNENDRGAYRMTKIFQHPSDYLLPHHNGLFDGVFKGQLHCETQSEGILPCNAAELRAAQPAMRNRLKKWNRVQRRLRVVIEQLFGMIEQWGLVGNTVYRADLELQGINFQLCTQLTAWLMAKRGRYPRGQRWKTDLPEDWENGIGLGAWMDVDPLAPDLY